MFAATFALNLVMPRHLAVAAAKFTEFEKPWLSEPQPMRTDCEKVLSGADFVDENPA